MVEALLKANPKAALEKDEDGNTPLHYMGTRQSELKGMLMKFVLTPSLDALEIWHEIVAVPGLAGLVAEVVGQHPGHESVKNAAGRTAYNNACGDCREAMDKALAFLGRYRIVRETHRSATALVLIAKDLEQENAPEVALKLMEGRDQFLQETATRKEYSLDKKYVVEVLRAHADSGVVAEGSDTDVKLRDLGVELILEPEYCKAMTLREEAQKYRCGLCLISPPLWACALVFSPA